MLTLFCSARQLLSPKSRSPFASRRAPDTRGEAVLPHVGFLRAVAVPPYTGKSSPDVTRTRALISRRSCAEFTLWRTVFHSHESAGFIGQTTLHEHHVRVRDGVDASHLLKSVEPFSFSPCEGNPQWFFPGTLTPGPSSSFFGLVEFATTPPLDCDLFDKCRRMPSTPVDTILA
jgi:hypothetical protein